MERKDRIFVFFMFGQGLFCLNSETMIDHDWNLANLVLCVTSITRADFVLAAFVGGRFCVKYHEFTPFFFVSAWILIFFLFLSI